MVTWFLLQVGEELLLACKVRFVEGLVALCGFFLSSSYFILCFHSYVGARVIITDV